MKKKSKSLNQVFLIKRFKNPMKNIHSKIKNQNNKLGNYNLSIAQLKK